MTQEYRAINRPTSVSHVPVRLGSRQAKCTRLVEILNCFEDLVKCGQAEEERVGSATWTRSEGKQCGGRASEHSPMWQVIKRVACPEETVMGSLSLKIKCK